jgi:plasmid stability protein
VDRKWSYFGVELELIRLILMNLSIKNAPDDVVALLKLRAKTNHRSLQGELLAIIEDAVRGARPARMIVDDILMRGRQLGLQTPDEAAAMVRADRDSR